MATYEASKILLKNVIDAIRNSNSNNCRDPKCDELEKEIRRLRKDINGDVRNLREHVDKVNQYRHDPLSMDNKGLLQDAIDAGDMDLFKKRFEGRLRFLFKTLDKHMKNGQKHTIELRQKINEYNNLGC